MGGAAIEPSAPVSPTLPLSIRCRGLKKAYEWGVVSFVLDVWLFRWR